MSPTTVARRLKLAGYPTPGAWVKAWRLRKAQRLLKEEGLSVAETAKALGYSRPESLTRLFHQALGMSVQAFLRRADQRLRPRVKKAK